MQRISQIIDHNMKMLIIRGIPWRAELIKRRLRYKVEELLHFGYITEDLRLVINLRNNLNLDELSSERFPR